MHPHQILIRARKQAGLKTRKEFAKALKANGQAILIARLGRLERGETNPTIREINAICETLNISADAYLTHKPTNTQQIINIAKQLKPEQRQPALRILELAFIHLK